MSSLLIIEGTLECEMALKGRTAEGHLEMTFPYIRAISRNSLFIDSSLYSLKDNDFCETI